MIGKNSKLNEIVSILSKANGELTRISFIYENPHTLSLRQMIKKKNENISLNKSGAPTGYRWFHTDTFRTG